MPAEQLSWAVHGLLSLQLALSAMGTAKQAPVVALQLSVVHELPSEQAAPNSPQKSPAASDLRCAVLGCSLRSTRNKELKERGVLWYAAARDATQ